MGFKFIIYLESPPFYKRLTAHKWGATAAPGLSWAHVLSHPVGLGDQTPPGVSKYERSAFVAYKSSGQRPVLSHRIWTNARERTTVDATGFPEWRAPVIPEWRAPAMSEWRASEMPEWREPEVPEWRAPEMPEWREPQMPECRA
jgi:hypothetical protein